MSNRARILVPLLGIVSVAAVGLGVALSVTQGSNGDNIPSTGSASPGSVSSERSLGETAVKPDPEYEAALRRAGISRSDWQTDFSLHTVPFDEITSVVPRDGIPAIDKPAFISPKQAEAWLGDQEPVISFVLNGDAKAYPLQILTWHEIVNDEVGGTPVAVTFCPLCNSAIVFDRRLNEQLFDFGVSGNLRNSDLIMYDRQTHSWWQQFTGDAIVGELSGERLEILSATITSFEDFKVAYPEGKVLSRQTGFSRDYGQNPYAGYDRADNPPFLFDGDTDGRLLPKERVVAVTIDDVNAAFPYRVTGAGSGQYLDAYADSSLG